MLGPGPQGDLPRRLLRAEIVRQAAFAATVAQQRVRPTALLPLWHAAGFALGAFSAALGERAATACALAVEEAIDEHHAEQAASLDRDEAGLRTTIERCRSDEPEQEVASAAGLVLLSRTIKLGCKLAISLSERI